MRYYKITITDPKTGAVWQPEKDGSGFTKTMQKGAYTFTSYNDNRVIPGALNIEFNIPVAPFNISQGQTMLRIWGVGLKMIGQGSQLAGQNIVLEAGMQKGLPLANPQQAGPIMRGTIWQGFGNWQGINQTLDLLINPPAAQPEQNISWVWPANTPLADALRNVCAQAFPFDPYGMAAPAVTIAALQQSYEEKGTYTSLAGFASYIYEASTRVGQATYGKDYAGVLISIVGNKLYAWDKPNPRKLIQLEFKDMVGQPTWIEAAKVNVRLVMRADIEIGMQIKFPAGIYTPYALTTTAAAVPNVPASTQSAFQDTFDVVQVNHFANFRQPDADSWVSAYDAVATAKKAA